MSTREAGLFLFLFSPFTGFSILLPEAEAKFVRKQQNS